MFDLQMSALGAQQLSQRVTGVCFVGYGAYCVAFAASAATANAEQ